MKKEKGFTLLELVMVIAITSIIVGLTGISYVLTVQINDLNIESQKIANMLDTAREQSLIRYNNSQYGVYFTSGGYSLFQGTTYSSSASTNINYTLPSDVKITSINIGPTPNIIFNFFDGTMYYPSSNASVTISTVVGNSSKIISINTQGNVSVQ